MKKLRTTIYICIITGLTLGSFVVVLAAFNPQINYQGKLTDTNDVAVADDDYNFEFKLWATSTATSSEYLKWTETCTSSSDKITVTNGLFSHLLGSVHSFSADDVDFNQTLWLEVSIAGTTTDPTSSDWETLSPRKKLGAVPAAFVAEKIGDYGTSSIAILSESETITGAWTFNNILSAAASSSSAILTVNQTGSGNLVDFQVATTSKFVINNSGEITTGEWKATPIGTQWGGTGQDWSTAATGSIPFATSTGVFALLAPGTSNYYLKSQGAGASPVWAEVAGGANYYGPTIIVAASDSTSTSRAHYTCDGTDDQVQINNAINALPAGIGGTVLLLEGNYSIATSGIDITTSSVSLIGSGKGTVLKRAYNSGIYDGVITVGDGSNSYEGVTIANLSIDGQKTTHSNSNNDCIIFNRNISKSRIQNTWIHDCEAEGIDLFGGLGGGSENTYNLIEGNDIRNNDGAGIYLYECDDNNISNNFVYSSSYAIYLNSYSERNTVSGNHVKTCTSWCISLASNSNYNEVLGNTVQSSSQDNIMISANYNTISGNFVTQSSDDGIVIGGAGNNNTVSGNVFYENDGDEIEVGGGDSNIVSSNSLYDTSDTCLNISSGNNNYIIGNEISGGCTEIVDNGTGTTIQQRDWFEVEASSTIAALTVQQDGSGNIVEIKNAIGTVFTIASSGNAFLAGDFLPATTTQYDLGSLTYKWANLFTATATLDVFKMATGATSSYVLTSDASGVGTWQQASDKKGPTLIVAASDSRSTSTADYVCDGTDDQVQINDAINALPAGIGGTVLLLEGNYSIGSSTDNIGINITTSSVALIGSGKGTVLQRAWDATNFYDPVIKVGDGSNSYEGVTIANLSINGCKAVAGNCTTAYEGTQNIGIYFIKNISESRIQNTWIHDCDGFGICLYGSYTDDYNIISGNLLQSNDDDGINIDGSQSNIISGNIFQENGDDGLYSFHGDETSIVGNVFKGNTGNGIEFYADKSTISGNVFDANDDDEIYLYIGDENTVTGNIIRGATGDGIYLSSAKFNSITGNTLYENYEHGIYLSSSNNNAITGNKIHKSGSTGAYDGIRITGSNSDNNLISSNDITDTSGSGYAINITSSVCENNYLIGNRYSGTGASSMNDSGTGTTIQQRDWFEVEPTTLSVNYPGLLIGSADTSWATGTQTYLGIAATSTFSGNLVDIQKAGTTEFKIDNNGNVTVAGNILPATTTEYDLGSSTYKWANLYSATATLDVFKMATGATSTYVLTSDASGVGTWQEAAGGTDTNYYGPTIIVAASDSTSTSRAHYQCDGTADQVEINNAINALPAGGGVIQLLEGTYNVTSTITVTSSVAIRGAGASTILYLSNSANTDVIQNSDQTNGNTNIHLSNFKIHGNDSNNTSGKGIYFKKVTYSKINNLWVYDCDDEGIELYDSDYNTFSDNYFYSNSVGLYIQWSSTYNTVSGNNFEANSTHIHLYNNCTSNTISGNNLKYSVGRAISLSITCDRNVISNNTIYMPGNEGIHLDGSEYNSIVGNNIYQALSDDGINLYDYSSFNTVSGNLIYNSDKHGIHITSRSDSNSITGNVIIDSDSGNSKTYDGISLDTESDNNIISSNRIQNSDRYEIYIASDCDNNYLIGNDTYGTDHEGEINDDGTGTVIQHKDLFEITASSTAAALTVTQSGSGNIVEIKNATGTVFTIASSGNATLAGDFLPATTTTYDLGSSTYKWANLYAATTTIGGTIIIGTDTITATSTLTISTGASTDLILTPGTGGSVGIGTTTPTGIFSVATSTGASVFYIGDDGNVGIGTTTPDYALDVAGPIRFRGWQDLSSPFTDEVESLTVWNGRLCAGSKDEHVRCYDGSTWEDLGDVGSHVYDLTVWNGKLCEGNNDNHVRCYATSTWEDLGDVGGCIDSITVWNGKLCEGNDDSHIKCYDGSTWEDLGSFDDVDVLAVWNGKLCVGDWSDHVRCYDGSTWEDLGDVGSNIYSLTVWNGKLCEGNVDGHVKCYDGSTWEDLGDVAGDYYVSALTVWNGKLCEGSTDDHVRCYDGSSWEDLGDFGNNIGVLAVWNGKLCEGDENFKVKCYFDSEALDNYWYKNGDILRWDRIVEAGDLYVEGNIGIGTKAPSSKLTITETGDFAFGDFNAQLVATMELVTDWTSSDGANTTTSLEISTVKVGSGALKITTTVGTSTNDTISKTIYSEDWSSYERLGFWVRADYTTTSTDATTSQIISIQFYCTSTPATTTHNITIQEMTKWQYQEWNISSATSTNIEWIRFRIDNDYGSPTFYIDHLRLYDDDERTSEMFVDKSGNLVMMGRGGVEITRPSTGSGQLPSLKIDAAVVELNQPLSVNVAGDVGFDYDLTFMNTGLSQITSEGPLKISAGDPNHAENLTLTTSGSGDIIVSLTQTGQTFRITHALAASTTVPFIIDSETTATSTPTGGLFRVVSDVNSDENVVFTIDAGGNYAFDGTATSGAEDIAENYIVEDETIEPGDVVALSQNKLVVEKSTQPYQENLIGVISSRPALVMAGTLPNSKPVTLAGRVPVKVSTEAGIIEIGDPLTSASSTPGVAMKATRPSRIIGYALEPFDGTTTSSSTEAGPLLAENATSTENAYGKILVFINVGETTLTVTETSDGKLTETRPLQLAEVPQFFVVNGDGSLGIQKVKVKELEVGRLKVGVPQNTTTTQTAANGITIYDRATGQPYCIFMENGQMRNVIGECGGEMSNAQAGEVSEPMVDGETGDTGGTSEPIINEEPPAEEPPAEETSTSTEPIPSADSTSSPQADSEPPCQPQTFYLDADGDNYGDPVNNISSCEQSTGYVTDNTDCNDSDPNVNPLATEICDGVDNDCDGQIDEDLFQQCGSTDVGACQFGTQTCQAGEWGECQGAIEPTEEICGDNFDNNCDGTTDENCQTEPATTTADNTGQ